MEVNDLESPLLNNTTKELSVKERYEMLLDHDILLDTINHAFHQQEGTLDKYYALYLQSQKRMLPSYLGTAYNIFKTISPGRAFKQVMNQLFEIMQMHYPLSKLDINWISDREVSIDVPNCHKRRKTGEYAKKLGLDINPAAMCGFEARFFREILKEFGVDMKVTLHNNGCHTVASLK